MNECMYAGMIACTNIYVYMYYVYEVYVGKEGLDVPVFTYCKCVCCIFIKQFRVRSRSVFLLLFIVSE